MLPDARMVEAALDWGWKMQVFREDTKAQRLATDGMLRKAFAALDRDAMIEAGARALAGRGSLQDPTPWARPELRRKAEAVLRAVGLIA